MADSSETGTAQVFRSNRGRNLQLVATRQIQETTTEAEVSSLKAQLAKYQQKEAALNEKEKELREIMIAIRVALGLMAQRVATLIALFASIAAFGWAVADPTGLRIAAACLFTVIVFLPALWADARRN